MKKIGERVWRFDWLGTMWLALLAGFGAAMLWVIARLSAPLRVRSGFVVDVHSDDVAAVSNGTVLGPTSPGGDWVRVYVDSPAAEQTLWHELTQWVPTALLVAVVLWLLQRVVRDAWTRDPFTSVTVRRLNILGVVTLAGGFLAEVAEGTAHTFLYRSLVGSDAQAVAAGPMTFWWLLPGLAFLAFGAVMRQGQAMRAELETVV